MASIVRNHLYTVDLNKPLIRESCGILLAEGDNGGDCFVFTLMRDGAALDPGNSCAVSAYFIRNDGSTVVFTGESTVHLASVTLPQSCYVAEGRFSLAVKVTMDGVTTTIAVLDGYIKSTQTDTLVDPGEVVPTLDELLAQIEAMEAATEAANTAAENAQEFIVTVTQPAYIIDGVTSGITANKTFAEIQAAITAGKTPVVRLKTSGQIPTQVLQLYMTSSTTIAFRQHAAAPSDYNVAGSTVCTFYSGGSITVSAVDFKVVPDGGTDGQVLVKKGESTYEWKDSGELAVVSELAPAIIPTATGGIVTISDSASRPFAGLRLYGKTTQDGTPTPDAPVELVNVGASGSIGVKACGKNLLPNGASTQEKNGVTFTVNDDGSIHISGTATANTTVSLAGSSTDYSYKLPAGDYILSGCNGVPSNTYFVKLRSDEKNPVAASYAGEQAFEHDGSDLWCYIYVFDGVTVDDTIYPMVRPASISDATYTPYEDGGSLSATTESGLPGIPVISGGNYTDGDGQQWLCDEKDFGRGVDVQRVGIRALDGTENWTAGSNAGAWNLYIGDAAMISSGSNYAHCTHYKYHGASYATMDDLSFKLTITSDGLGEYMAVKDTSYDSLDAWKAALAANPITVYYILKAPIETALTADEIAAYRAMTSHKPNTTVYNDGGAGLEVDYIADTKTYIDQRISALLNA